MHIRPQTQSDSLIDRCWSTHEPPSANPHPPMAPSGGWRLTKSPAWLRCKHPPPYRFFYSNSTFRIITQMPTTATDSDAAPTQNRSLLFFFFFFFLLFLACFFVQDSFFPSLGKPKGDSLQKGEAGGAIISRAQGKRGREKGVGFMGCKATGRGCRALRAWSLVLPCTQH